MKPEGEKKHALSKQVVHVCSCIDAHSTWEKTLCHAHRKERDTRLCYHKIQLFHNTSQTLPTCVGYVGSAVTGHNEQLRGEHWRFLCIHPHFHVPSVLLAVHEER